MKKVLEGIKKVKDFAKIATILKLVVNILAIIFLVIIIVSAAINSPGLFLFALILFIIISIAGGILKIVFLILLLVNSTSIYTNDIKNNNVKEVVDSYKTTILILSIIAFFLFSFIMFIIMWVISNSKIKFLEQEIEELEIKNQKNPNKKILEPKTSIK